MISPGGGEIFDMVAGEPRTAPEVIFNIPS